MKQEIFYIHRMKGLIKPSHLETLFQNISFPFTELFWQMYANCARIWWAVKGYCKTSLIINSTEEIKWTLNELSPFIPLCTFICMYVKFTKLKLCFLDTCCMSHKSKWLTFAICLSFFFFCLFYWGIVALQCCIGFSRTMKWTSHNIYIYPLPLWTPCHPHPYTHPIHPGHHRALNCAPCTI